MGNGLRSVGPGANDHAAKRGERHVDANRLSGVRVRHAGENGNTNRFRGAFQARPGAAYDLIARFRRHTPMNNWNAFGLAMRESATGKLLQFGLTYDGGGVGYITWGNETSYGSGRALYTPNAPDAVPWDWWCKIHDDHSSTVHFYFSLDGNYWVDLGTLAYGSAFTTAPDQVGIGINSNFASTNEQVFDCGSFKAA